MWNAVLYFGIQSLDCKCLFFTKQWVCCWLLWLNCQCMGYRIQLISILTAWSLGYCFAGSLQHRWLVFVFMFGRLHCTAVGCKKWSVSKIIQGSEWEVQLYRAQRRRLNACMRLELLDNIVESCWWKYNKAVYSTQG